MVFSSACSSPRNKTGNGKIPPTAEDDRPNSSQAFTRHIALTICCTSTERPNHRLPFIIVFRPQPAARNMIITSEGDKKLANEKRDLNTKCHRQALAGIFRPAGVKPNTFAPSQQGARELDLTVLIYGLKEEAGVLVDKLSNGDCIDRKGVRILNTAVSGDGQEHS